MAAAKNGLFSTTAYLLKEGGASPKAANKAGETALYAAGNSSIVKLLNENGITKGLRQKIQQ
jgi:ankyrin repeat protein